MSKPRKTHVVDVHMPHLTPCGRGLTDGKVLVAASPEEPSCAWCLSYIRGAWGAGGLVTPTSEPLR
ncbi:MAG: hypothetical protein EHM78_23415 [Myxococcaceae bacterium]|nr:MAG: hypothetical protein EHM78_23415 [Myxococcaceae bacterium]